MSAIKFSTSDSPAKKTSKPQLRVFGAAVEGKNVSLVGSDLLTVEQLQALGVTGKAESLTRTLVEQSAIAIIGLGSGDPSIDEWRELGGALGRGLGDTEALELHLPVSDLSRVEALFEGIALGNYSYEGKPDKKAHNLKRVHLVGPLSIDKAALARVEALASAVHLARNLAARPANLLFPSAFADLAEKQTADSQIEVQVWDEKKLAKDGFGLISAVGMGSVRPPRLVKLSYTPSKGNRHLALVGKGITFDTGGLAVKPLGGMLGMKYDMAGAATVFGAIQAIAELKLPIKVTAYLCLAENMPSGSAMRPGDVFVAKNGKTVEVTNPDAEGRLVLADGISAASSEHPDLIVDVATLTGAARVALGVRYAGLMGSAEGIRRLESASARAGEPVWAMPLAKELRAHLDSPVADLQNSKVGSSFGGMIVGGWFLSEFVGVGKNGEKIDWAHLDIAGPADNEGSAYGYTPKGPTGAMLRSLVALAEEMCAD